MASSGLELKLIFSAAGMGGIASAFGSVTSRMENLTKASAATVERMNKAGLSILDAFVKQKTALGALSGKMQEHESQMAKMAKSVADATKKQDQATEALLKYRQELGTTKRTDEQRAEVERLRKASVEAAQASKYLSQQFDAQRVKGKQLKEEFMQQNRQVQQLRDEMRKAGINTAKLGEERGRLRKLMEQEQATLSKLTSKYERLAAVQRDVGKYRQEFNDRKMNVVAAAGVAASLAVPVVTAASYEDRVKQISITGELYKEKGAEASLSGKIRQAATRYGVSHENVTAGVDKLVAQGMNANVAGSYAGMLAKTAKATRADMGDLAELVYTLQTKFKLKTEGEIFEAINVLAKAGKLGSYEIKAMAKAFPELGGAAASFGSTGMQGVKEMGALMQTMRAGAGSAGEAETYMRNWFSHMSAATTQKHFESVGIDFEKSKLAKVTEGKGKVSNVEASFMVFDDYINKVVSSGQVKTYDKKGKLKTSTDIKDELKVAFEQAKKDGLQGEAMQQFMQSALARVGLSGVVQDIQATQAYLAWMTGKDKYHETRTELDKAGVKQTVDNDFAEQNKLLTQQWENLKTSMTDLSITVGKVLAPALTDLLGTLSVVVGYVNTFAQENPKLASGLIVVAGGIAAFTSVLLALGAAASLARLSLAAARGLPLIGGALGNPSGIAAAVKPAATGSGVLSKLAAGVKGIKLPAGSGAVLSKAAMPLAVGMSLFQAGSALAADGMSRSDKASAVGGAAGSLAGGLAGAKLGALIGTAVFPGVGTAVGGLVGGIGGALLGDYMGGKGGKALAGSDKPKSVFPKVAAPTAPVPAPPAAVKLEYKPQITIQGDPTPQTMQRFDQMLRAHQKTIEDMLKKYSADQQRRAY